MYRNRALTISDYLNTRPLIRLPPSVIQKSDDEHPFISFTLMTYNILAQDHIHRTAYPYCGKLALRWSHRREVLEKEIEAYDADIMCFQEMDRFHDYFQPLLERLGYENVYYLRNGPRSDVNCVAWKRDKFKLIESKMVSFENTTSGLGSVPNICQMAALQSKSEARLKLVIATTHLYWREDCDHIRLAQMHSLMRELLIFRDHVGKDFLPIIAGDLNSDRDSMAVKAVLRSSFCMEPEPFDQMVKESKMTPSVLKQILSDFTINWPKLYDAHAHYASIVPGPNGYELPFTTFCLYKGILDFILYCQYDQGSIECKDLRITPTAIRIIPEREVLEKEVALPNLMFASDHLALMTDFTVFHKHTPE